MKETSQIPSSTSLIPRVWPAKTADRLILFSGLPVTNWKKRAGYEIRGTMAECVEKWLSLPDYQKRDCRLRVDDLGSFEGNGITRLVKRYGLPPRMAARLGMWAAQYLEAIKQRPYERPASADPISLGHGSARDDGDKAPR
ncbi:MAG TPA: hypothetical protein VMO78_15635 [Rhizomicrobium sp.]|nr:hypothetical protein [Rhizomicrobium sp.]